MTVRIKVTCPIPDKPDYAVGMLYDVPAEEAAHYVEAGFAFVWEEAETVTENYKGKPRIKRKATEDDDGNG